MSTAAPRGHVLSAGPAGAACVVFVHGIEDSWRTWTRLARCLGSGWRSIALDLPWRAGNDYSWRWASSPGDWVRAGLDVAVGDRPCILVGHSFGANAVLARLSEGERRATATVLAAPFFRPADAIVTWRTFEISRKMFERQISDGLRVRLRGTPQPDIFEVMLAKTCERIGPIGFLTVFEQYVASGYLKLSQVDIPALVMIGEDDPGVFAPHVEALVSRLPRGDVARGPDFDHFCHIRRAPEVARAIANLAGSRQQPEPDLASRRE